MTALTVQSPLWTWRRWCLLISLTFCAQLALIFFLADKSPTRVRPSSPAPRLAVVEDSSSEMIALTDPTLFALPHQVGFSGPAWMKTPPVPKIPPVPSRPFEWTEEPSWLALPIEQLGNASTAPADTNQTELPTTFAFFEPEPSAPEPVLAASFRQKSEFRLGEGLQQRRLKTFPKLPSWPHSDFLTNTVVKLFINGDGVPVSTPVLLSSSGLKAADDFALAQASAARFDPILNEGPGRFTNPLANSTWGTMIFEWHTLPLSATNTGSANPQ
jgi:hypothetical protein